MNYQYRLPNPLKPSKFLGKQAAKAMEELIRDYQSIKKIRICQYEPPLSLQQRIKMDKIEEKLVDSALKIRQDVGMPFWEALFAACLKHHKFTEPLLDAALHHHGVGRESEIIRSDILKGKLVELAHTLSENRSIGLSSEVELVTGEIQHFVFLDFHCDVLTHNTILVSEVCARLLPEGYLLLDSGDSYHAWGIQLVTPEERIRILGKSLFFMPIVDGTYIAHQLIQNTSSIRLSVGGKRKLAPKVIKVGCTGA